MRTATEDNFGRFLVAKTRMDNFFHMFQQDGFSTDGDGAHVLTPTIALVTGGWEVLFFSAVHTVGVVYAFFTLGCIQPAFSPLCSYWSVVLCCALCRVVAQTGHVEILKKRHSDMTALVQEVQYHRCTPTACMWIHTAACFCSRRVAANSRACGRCLFPPDRCMAPSWSGTRLWRNPDWFRTP